MAGLDFSALYELGGYTTPPTQKPTPQQDAARDSSAAILPAAQPAGAESSAMLDAQPQPRAQEVAQPTRAAQEMPPDLSSLADDFPRFVGALQAAGRPTYSTYKFARLDVSTGSTWEGIIQARQVAQPRPVTDTAAQDMSAETARG